MYSCAFSFCSQPKGDWQGYWENPPCPPPPTPRTLSPCLSAGDTPVSGCFSYPLQCRIQPDVTMMSAAAAAAGSSLSPTPQLLMTPAPHSAPTSTSVKWGFQKVTANLLIHLHYIKISGSKCNHFWRFNNKQCQTNTAVLPLMTTHTPRLTLWCCSRKRQTIVESKESKSELHLPSETCELWGTILLRSLFLQEEQLCKTSQVTWMSFTRVWSLVFHLACSRGN